MHTDATKECRRSHARPTDPPRHNAAGIGSRFSGPYRTTRGEPRTWVSSPECQGICKRSVLSNHTMDANLGPRTRGLQHSDECPSPRPHQQWSSLGRQELAPIEPKLRRGLVPENLPQPPKHWNLSLVRDSNSPPQDRIRQSVIFILDAEERGFVADSVDKETGAERALCVSLQTIKSTTVSELVAAVSHECQRRGIT